MSEPIDKRKSFKEKFSDKYRLVIIDDDTLGEVKTMRFSLIGLFLSLFVFFLLLTAVCYAIIAFSPLKYTVPGYAEIENNKVYMDLNKRLAELEEELDAQRIYTNGLKNLLNPSGQDIEDDILHPTNNSNSESRVQLEHLYLIPPIKGEISASFDLKKNHMGVDLIAPKDTPVKCVLDGVVINADWTIKTGNTISIQHSNDLLSVYKHNSTLLKKIGESVSAGEAIAIIGNTGELTSGPHVHFELWNNGVAVNPEDYITFD